MNKTILKSKNINSEAFHEYSHLQGVFTSSHLEYSRKASLLIFLEFKIVLFICYYPWQIYRLQLPLFINQFVHDVSKNKALLYP